MTSLDDWNIGVSAVFLDFFLHSYGHHSFEKMMVVNIPDDVQAVAVNSDLIDTKQLPAMCTGSR